MSRRKIALPCILILLVSASAFAQAETPPPPRVVPIESLFLDEPALADFLPPGEGSWSLTVITSGGILGLNKLTAAVNSAGEVLCPQNSSVVKNLVAREKLTRLNDLTAKLDLKAAGVVPGAGAPPPSFCNDCFIKTIAFSRRVKDKPGVETYSFRVTTADDDAVSKVFREALSLADCR